MKRSSRVLIGTVLGAGMIMASSACTSEPDQEFMEADHQQICVSKDDSGQMERRPDHECSGQSEDGGTSACIICWYFLGRAFGTPPAVGSRFNPGTYGSFTKPAGTVAKPPATGGFGTTKVSVGG